MGADLKTTTPINGRTWWHGEGYNGGGVATAQRIECNASCGGQTNIPDCVEGAPVGYYAHGKVTIYHQFNPEIDTTTGGNGFTQCAPSGDGGGQCDVADDGGPWNDGGTSSPDDPQGCCYSYCSPILIDPDRGPFHLTGTEQPVSFDIDADGDLDSISWTASETEEAFLRLDRNGNGFIDDGKELFGVATDQPPSPENAAIATATASVGAARPTAGTEGRWWRPMSFLSTRRDR